MKVNKTIAVDIELAIQGIERAGKEGRSFSSWINELLKKELGIEYSSNEISMFEEIIPEETISEETIIEEKPEVKGPFLKKIILK